MYGVMNSGAVSGGIGLPGRSGRARSFRENAQVHAMKSFYGFTSYDAIRSRWPKSVWNPIPVWLLQNRGGHGCDDGSPQAGLWPQQERRVGAHASSSGGSGWMDMPESQPLPEEPVEIFPRMKERDPYKLLGISQEASFEEVQDARNYLYEQYKRHEPSRESIELAFDEILQSKMKFRHKYGFQPPNTGKKSDATGTPKVSFWERVRDMFEPNVSSVTMVNDGSIFLALALWAAWQATSSDPTLPLGAAVAFCVWKLYDKRNKRNPDGPYFGGSPIWGALFTTIGSLISGGLLSFVLAQVLPLPPKVSIDAMSMFVITMGLGCASIFLK